GRGRLRGPRPRRSARPLRPRPGPRAGRRRPPLLPHRQRLDQAPPRVRRPRPRAVPPQLRTLSTGMSAPMSHSGDRLRHTRKGAAGAPKRGGIAMKFMLLQHYGRVEGDVPPMSQWAPEDVVAHIQFQKDLNAELRERGEFVEAQALTGPEAAKFVLASDDAPIVTDGPFAESKELLAGWRTVDVESEERAL